VMEILDSINRSCYESPKTGLIKFISEGTQMSNDQDLFQEGKKDPTVDSNSGSGPDEFGSDEIIELTDVVSEGKDPFESDTDAPLLFDEVKSDFKFEDSSAFEKPEDILADLEKDEYKAEEFHSVYEGPDEDEKPIDIPADLDGDDEADEKPGSGITHDIPGISEEKMKELLTEVIQETVDKAVRETVSEVAEKVIREAIDALKQSIASSDT